MKPYINLVDQISSRGFIHNRYQDSYGNKYRIVQSSGHRGGIWIFGDTVVDDEGRAMEALSSSILITKKELKGFIKNLKKASKGRKKDE